jgi:hypothetical protein
MIEAARSWLADAVDTLTEIDALLERGAALPPLLLARALVRIEGIAVRLARLRLALAGALAENSAGSGTRDAPGAG